MEDGIYRFGEFTLSPSERQLERRGKSVPLPPRAFDALHLLVRRRESLVRRNELFSTLWPGVHVTEARLTNLIVILRRIMGPSAIQTASKFGYRFTLPVTGEPGIAQDAYALFARGKELLTERTADSVMRAQDLFWLCLEKDPHFAPGRAWWGEPVELLRNSVGIRALRVWLGARVAYSQAMNLFRTDWAATLAETRRQVFRPQV